MKTIWIFLLLLALFALVIAFGYEAPPEVVNAMANDAWGGMHEPALTRDELKAHLLTNWRKIAAEIEALPISKFDLK